MNHYSTFCSHNVYKFYANLVINSDYFHTEQCQFFTVMVPYRERNEFLHIIYMYWVLRRAKQIKIFQISCYKYSKLRFTDYNFRALFVSDAYILCLSPQQLSAVQKTNISS